MTTQQIVLASQSPRRKQLLEWAELNFDIIVRPTEETYPPGMDPVDVPIHIARNKAIAVQASDQYKRYEKDAVILAADTIVVLENTIFGKPADREDAIRILSELSGKTHQVITGVVILYKDKEISFADTTGVSFHNLDQTQISFYVDKYKPYD